MLSAYELNGGVDQVLLDQSKILSEKLVHGWVGNNTLPWTTLDFTTDSPVFGGVSSPFFLFLDLRVGDGGDY